MSEWQPIETAPRDGRSILIFEPADSDYPQLPRADDWRFAIGYWRRTGSWGNRNAARVNPTHWMPLPELPKVATPF